MFLKPQASLATSRVRRGFNLVEMLIALAITAALLTATIVALNASFMAYKATTEVASTHAIGRLTMHRLMAMVRISDEFEPKPTNPLDSEVFSDYMQFRNPNGEVLEVRWDEDSETLFVSIDYGTEYALLEGVKPQYDEDGNRIKPFTLVYERGMHLYRATVDLLVKPDDNMSMSLDGDNEETIRLVASAMPRTATY